MIRSAFVLFIGALATIWGAWTIVIARLLGIPATEGGVYERAIRRWARTIVGVAGVRVTVHGEENLPRGGAVLISNHVSWFDVFALASRLGRISFVAKTELRSIPVFGWGAEAVGIVFLDRDNRKQAFESYKVAAGQVQSGYRVVVFPEGTRGTDYHLRPFKKGPFVLAISSQQPIVPTVVHGAIEVMGKDSFTIRPGEVHIHFLPQISTDGRTYDDRTAIVAETHAAMEELLASEYGVEAPLEAAS